MEIILFGLVAGFLYGAGVTVVTEKRRRDVRAAIGDVPRGQISDVSAAKWGRRLMTGGAPQAGVTT